MQIPDYSIYDDNKELLVKICKYHAPVTLSDQELELLKKSHVALFKDVLHIRPTWLESNFDRADKNYLVVPLHFIPFVHPMVAYINFDLARRLASLKADESRGAPAESGSFLLPIKWPAPLEEFENAIVTRKYDRECKLNEVKEISSSIRLSSPPIFEAKGSATYKDYFSDKYDCTFTDDAQPALICKPLAEAESRLQLLKSRYKTHDGADIEKSKNRSRTIELFPEICMLYPLPTSLWKLARCVPSILWRIECILAVDELRRRISTETGIGQFPSGTELELTTRIDFRGYKDMGFGNLETQKLAINQFGELEMQKADLFDPLKFPLRGPNNALLLQALTTKSADDTIDMERLETLGDSFLKFSTTVFLYCDRSTAHEGKLSKSRSRRISNLNLFCLARQKRITDTIFSLEFVPRQMWTPPGFVFDRNDPHLTTLSGGGDGSGDRDTLPGEQASLGHPSSEEERHYLYHKVTQKGVADCVESLTGAYLVSGGIQAGLRFMTWVGIKMQPEEPPVSELEDMDLSEVSDGVSEMEEEGARDGSELEEGEVISSVESYSLPPRPKLRKLNAPSLFIQNSAAILGRAFGRGSNQCQLNQQQETELNRLLSISSASSDTTRSICGWKFRDRALLLQAITHASYSRNRVTNSYQRLEFLGDAVLDYLVTCHIYSTFPEYDPGDISSMRSALVNNFTFAELAVKIKLHSFLLYASPALNTEIERYLKAVQEARDREETELESNEIFIRDISSEVRKEVVRNNSIIT